jgi:hypothetical protein
MLLLFCYITLILYGVTFIFSISGIKSYEIVPAISAITVNLITLILIFYNSGHFPGYNIFESFLFASFVLGCLAIFSPWGMGFKFKIRLWVWIEILILLIIALLISKGLDSSGFDYSYIYKVMFTIFRSLSIAAMLYATAYFIQFIMEREFNERANWLAHTGRNFLILSTVLFLVSEYTGIIWCQREFGDFWEWSKNFLQSTIIMSYLMLAFHIPGKGRRAEYIRSFIGGLSGVFVVTLTILRSFF